MAKKKKIINSKKDKDIKEYGVVLKKEKRYKHKIFPQKGKVPEEDESFKVV